MLSVCVPTYNGATYLTACLDSILSQSFADFEVVIVDDGSSDETPEIIRKFAALDARVKTIHNDKNLGLVENWNRCIDLAQGEWIKFVFQDDVLSADCLHEMQLAASDGVRFVACNRKFQFESGTTDQTRRFYLDHKLLVETLFANRTSTTAQEFAALACERIGANLVGEPTCTLIHRSVFEELGRFNPDLIMSCDLEYWLRIGIHVGIRFIQRELVTFRVHARATSALNRRDRQYRMNVIDDLLIWHDVVHHATYAPIRDAACARTPPVPLKRILSRKAHEARVTAERMDRARAPRERSVLADWRACTARYPALRVGGVNHFVWCVRNQGVAEAAKRGLLEN